MGGMPAAEEFQLELQVEGMTCAGCEAHAREAIEAIPGVASVAVSYRDGRAEVVWNRVPDDAAVSAAVDELGYRVAGRE